MVITMDLWVVFWHILHLSLCFQQQLHDVTAVLHELDPTTHI